MKMNENWSKIRCADIVWPSKLTDRVVRSIGVETLGELAVLSGHELLKWPGCGPTTVRHIVVIVKRAIAGELQLASSSTVESMARELLAEQNSRG